MSGELLVKNRGGWRTVLAVLLACVGAAALSFLFARFLPLESGLARGATIALLAYVLFRVFYPVCDDFFSKKAADRDGIWRVTEDTLYLNDLAIPRSTIKMVHCWPSRDALGHSGGGWVINIETTGKNHVLRSLTQGEDVERSATQLRAMVTALGYGSQWHDPNT